jgi:hypothetical protein
MQLYADKRNYRNANACDRCESRYPHATRGSDDGFEMIRTDTPEFIAERKLYAVNPAGEKTPFSIRIGKPYAELDGKRWACPVWLDGLDDRYADIRGMDSLQAVTLAIAFAGSMMDGFAKRGHTFQYSTGQVVSVDDLLRFEFPERP